MLIPSQRTDDYDFRDDYINIKGHEMNQSRRTLNVPEAAKMLGIGRSAAYAAAASGELPTIRIGKRILVPLAAIDSLLGHGENRETDPQGVRNPVAS
jgi:excisionase family DNA binding protein